MILMPSCKKIMHINDMVTKTYTCNSGLPLGSFHLFCHHFLPEHRNPSDLGIVQDLCGGDVKQRVESGACAARSMTTYIHVCDVPKMTMNFVPPLACPFS